jgi:hypothetical protein
MIASAAGFFSYFCTMKWYGFPASILFGISGEKYVEIPWKYNEADVDPTSWSYETKSMNKYLVNLT